MTNDFHDACTKGTLDWFAAMFDFYPKPIEAHELDKAECITAVTTFGGALPGAAALTIPEAALPAIIIRHTGDELAPQGKALRDALLDLKKIWTSNMRVHLDTPEGRNVFVAQPWLIRGSHTNLRFPDCAVPVTSAFSSEAGPFLLATACQARDSGHG